LSRGSEQTAAVIATIFLRDQHRIFRLHHLVRVMAGVFGVLLVSLYCTYVLLCREPLFRYIFTNTYGQVVQLIPVDQPKQTDEYVMKWAQNVAVEAYTFDYQNYKRQLFWAQNDLTVVGWKEWQKALETSGNFRAVLGNKYVSTAVPNGPATIVKRGDFNGRYAWRVRFPILVVYQSSQMRTNQELMIEAMVIRQPEFVNISGLGIRQIIAVGGGT
jgi:intracellular multiplication protein IcmL